MRFKIDLASLLSWIKIYLFSLFYFLFKGNFSNTTPPPRGGGGLCLEGRFKGRLFALSDWGAYIWRGLFSEFYVSLIHCVRLHGKLFIWQMTLLPWEIASVRVTRLSRDTFTMGNIHGYVKKSKETAHDIKLGKKLGFSIPKQNNHQVSSK